MAKSLEEKPLTPPYVAFATFKTMIAGFKEHVLPSRVDRSVLGNFSGIVGGQLLTTLRFLGLVNSAGEPNGALRNLVSAVNTQQWPDALRLTIEGAYAPIFKLNLQTASPSQFNEHFATTYPGEGSTQRKSMTFLLTAIQEAKIPISPYILKNKKPRSALGKRRAPRQNGGGRHGESRQDNPPPPFIPPTDRKLSEQLLGVLDSEELPEDVEAAVFTLLRYLRKEGK